MSAGLPRSRQISSSRCTTSSFGWTDGAPLVDGERGPTPALLRSSIV
jgi:hypothetical protein